MTQATVDGVRSALKAVKEKALGRDIVSLGMVKKIEVEKDFAYVQVDLPTPVYRDRSELEKNVQKAACTAPGIKDARCLLGVNVPSGSRGQATRLPSVKNVIAVAAGKGGVGKSTVATNLAASLRLQGARVGLLDADVYGPSLPTMLGEPEVAASTRAGNKIGPAVYYGMSVISVGFFTERDGAVVWRGPMVHKLLQQFIEDVEWGDLDYLIVDLPPGTGDAQLSLTQLLPLTGVVIVSTPQEVALIDVEKAVSMFKKLEVPILGVIENMSYYICPTCGHHDDIFARGGGAKLAENLKVPLLGEVPLDRKVRYGGDSGCPIVISATDSEHGKIFMEVGQRVAEGAMKVVLSGPRRPAGLVQVK
ncbi:MAG TPA: P-loop NTPase [Pseudomonadota bacterium]|nr:P-loop NTPase [Pseudomonadota bacterium]HNO69165.1 P-loop NTPase [Pseudomonadota bacterium]